MTHTPGPWSVQRDRVSVLIPVGVAGCHNACAYAGTEANAALIASAPALLEALVELDAVLGDTPMPDCATMNKLIAASSKARAAISQATGEQQ